MSPADGSLPLESPQPTARNGKTPNAPPVAKAPHADKDHVSARPANDPGENFDWSDPDNLAYFESPALAVYRGKNGHLVIRQERGWNDDDDLTICIPPDRAELFLLAVQTVAQEK